MAVSWCLEPMPWSIWSSQTKVWLHNGRLIQQSSAFLCVKLNAVRLNGRENEEIRIYRPVWSFWPHSAPPGGRWGHRHNGRADHWGWVRPWWGPGRRPWGPTMPAPWSLEGKLRPTSCAGYGDNKFDRFSRRRELAAKPVRSLGLISIPLQRPNLSPLCLKAKRYSFSTVATHNSKDVGENFMKFLKFDWTCRVKRRNRAASKPRWPPTNCRSAGSPKFDSGPIRHPFQVGHSPLDVWKSKKMKSVTKFSKI